MFKHIKESYINYKLESSFINGGLPNNIFNFTYLYFFTDTYFTTYE